MAAFFAFVRLQYHQMNARSIRHTPQHTIMVISAGL